MAFLLTRLRVPLTWTEVFKRALYEAFWKDNCFALAAQLAYFKYYVANWGNYTETYGLIGAVMILLLWFYISGLVLLIGAEMNAEIEHASPEGKDPGEKVRGQKRSIPSRAMRRWKAWRRGRGEHPPSAQEVKAVVSDRTPSRDQ